MTGQQEVRLNLVLSAKDEANKVIDQAIAKIKKQFEDLGKSISKILSPDLLAKPVAQGVDRVNAELKRINMKPVEESGKKMSEATFVPLEKLRANFEQVRKELNNTSLESVKAVDLTTYQLKRLNQEAGLLPKNVEVYRDRIKEAFNQVNNAIVMTREEANRYFEEHKSQLKNDVLAQAEATQLSTGMMKKVIEGLMGQRVEFIKQSEAQKEYTKSLESIEKSQKKMLDTVILTKEELVNEFQLLQQKYKEHEIATLEVTQLTEAQMKKWVQGLTGVRVEVVRSLDEIEKKTKESVDVVNKVSKELERTEFMTKEQLVQVFKELQKEYSNSKIAMLDYTKLTESQLKKWVQLYRDAKIEIVDSMNSIEMAAKELAGTFGEKLDFVGLQIMGQTLMDFSRQVGGFLLDATKEAATFDTEMHGIISSFKVHDPQLKNEKKLYDDLAQAALNYGSKGFYSANKVAETMNALAKQGIQDKDTLINLLDTVHTVAVANQQDLQQTANVVADIYRQFGKTILKEEGDVTKAFQAIGDNMTSALHSANISMTDFLNTMKYVGPVAGSVGWNIRDAAEAIALFGKHGITGSMTGTALNKMLISLIPTTSKQIDLFKRLGFITKDNQNIFLNQNGTFKHFDEIIKLLHEHLDKLPPAQKEVVEKAIFGQHHFGALNGIIETTNQDLADLEKNFGKSGIASKAAAERADSLGVKMNGLNESIKTLKKAIGEPLKGPMGQLIDWAQQLIHWFVNLPKPVRDTTVLIIGLTAAAAGLAGAFFLAVGTLGLFADSFAVGLGLLADAAPIIAGVGLAIGAIVIAANKLKDAWDHDTGHIREKVKQLQQSFDQFKKDAEKKWDELQKKWDKVSSSMQKRLNDYGLDWDNLKKRVQRNVNDMQFSIESWWAKMGPDAEKASHRVSTAFDGLFKALKIAEDIGKMNWEAAWYAMGVTINAFLSHFKVIINDLGNLLGDYGALAIDLANGDWQKAWDDMQNIVEDFKRFLSDVFLDLPEQMYKWAQKMLGNFQAGWKSKEAQLKKDIHDFGQWIKDHLGHFSPAKKGPLSTDDKWFPNMMKMFAKGIEENRPLIQKELFKMAMDMQYALDPNMNKNQAIKEALDFSRRTYNALHLVSSESRRKELPAPFKHFLQILQQNPINKEYDRIPGHGSHIPPTTSLYDRVAGHGAHHVTININIEGRSQETDRRLVDLIEERLGRKFRTHVPMHIA